MKILGKSEKGFTLMELIIILAILGILAAVLVPNVGKFLGKGNTEAAAAELQAVQSAIDLYMADNAVATIAAAASVSNFSTSNPALYPDYVRQQSAGGGRTYSWNTGGTVTSP